MMRNLAVAAFGLTLISLVPPALAQDSSPDTQNASPQNASGMPAGLLPGSYSQAPQLPARGSEDPTVPGGDHTASAAPVGADTAAASGTGAGNTAGNGMVLGGGDASAALPEMQVPQRPGEGKGTLQ